MDGYAQLINISKLGKCCVVALIGARTVGYTVRTNWTGIPADPEVSRGSGPLPFPGTYVAR